MSDARPVSVSDLLGLGHVKRVQERRRTDISRIHLSQLETGTLWWGNVSVLPRLEVAMTTAQRIAQRYPVTAAYVESWLRVCTEEQTRQLLDCFSAIGYFMTVEELATLHVMKDIR